MVSAQQDQKMMISDTLCFFHMRISILKNKIIFEIKRDNAGY
jgi:hypothetical protein